MTYHNLKLTNIGQEMLFQQDDEEEEEEEEWNLPFTVYNGQTEAKKTRFWFWKRNRSDLDLIVSFDPAYYTVYENQIMVHWDYTYTHRHNMKLTIKIMWYVFRILWIQYKLYKR